MTNKIKKELEEISKIKKVAIKLLKGLKQDGIGLEYNNEYIRITKDTNL